MPAPAVRGRLGAVLAASLISVVIIGAAPDAVAAGKAPRGLTRFKAAVGSIESGGRYDARNPRSGAYGRTDPALNWTDGAQPPGQRPSQATHGQERVA